MLTIFLYIFLSLSNDNQIIAQAKNIQSKYESKNKSYVVIIDYSKSIDTERLYLVDMVKSKVILKSIVSHARNSGLNTPVLFSNEMNTKKSSLGVYVTKRTYYGSFGYSLILKGLESTNSNAEKRYIIFHSNKLMKTKYSWGCFATPESINLKLINLIKDGCLVYVHGN